VSDDPRIEVVVDAINDEMTVLLNAWNGDRPKTNRIMQRLVARDVLALADAVDPVRNAEIERLTAEVEGEIRDREYWEERFTKLCYSLASEEEIGEWSSSNDLGARLIEHISGTIDRLTTERDRMKPLYDAVMMLDRADRGAVAANLEKPHVRNVFAARKALAAALDAARAAEAEGDPS
jgi:hypothetical protein